MIPFREIYKKEIIRQKNTISLIAAENILPNEIRKFMDGRITNKTTEGISRHRFHGGCVYIDEIELEAIEKAKKLFGAKFAQVQPHSCTQANQAVIFSLLREGEKILSMSLDTGGHITHGNPSIIGELFKVAYYGVDKEGLLDYHTIREIARTWKPRLIICGASSYPRLIDYSLFRAIADEVNAYLLADIAHVAGLIAAGLHPNPVNHAHFVTSSTYKTLRGPRGGFILMGKDYNLPSPKFKNKTLANAINQTICPGIQSAIHPDHILGKLLCFELAQRDSFRIYQNQVIENAKTMAEEFNKLGYTLYTGGTENHLLLIYLSIGKMTGYVAEKALEECNIILNRNMIPNDERKPSISSGIRIGTPSMTSRGLQKDDAAELVRLIDKVLCNINAISETEYNLDHKVKTEVRKQIRKICLHYPLW